MRIREKDAMPGLTRRMPLNRSMGAMPAGTPARPFVATATDQATERREEIFTKFEIEA